MTEQETAILREQALADARIVEEHDAPTDDTMVWFEGESVRWGDLMVQDRKAYLAGGFPF